ncbi:MAG: GntR family transcriptional regulator [Caulobacter sp.]
MQGRTMKPGQRVMVALRTMIASGELKAGERIAEIPTAEALGVSRMPVRTALRALEQEGLVIKLGQRGYAARGFTLDHVIGAIEVRGVLEGYAARRAAQAGLSAKLEASLSSLLAQGDALFEKGSLTPGDLERYHAFNLQFHELIIEAAQSPALAQALERNNQHPFASAAAMAADWRDSGSEFERLSQAHQQHHAVFAAMRAGNGDLCEQIMRHHALAAVEARRLFAGAGPDAIRAD